jgi:uncharacterized membrane protein YkvA (DUF1232 family)
MSSSFEHELEAQVAAYDGPHFKAIRLSPSVYACVVGLLNDPGVPQRLRLKLFAVMGYFVLAEDLYPESVHGAEGFIDDVMLALTVMSEVDEINGRSALEQHWKSEASELTSCLDDYLPQMIEDRYELYERVMEYMGF